MATLGQQGEYIEVPQETEMRDRESYSHAVRCRLVSARRGVCRPRQVNPLEPMRTLHSDVSPARVRGGSFEPLDLVHGDAIAVIGQRRRSAERRDDCEASVTANKCPRARYGFRLEARVCVWMDSLQQVDAIRIWQWEVAGRRAIDNNKVSVGGDMLDERRQKSPVLVRVGQRLGKSDAHGYI